MSEAPEAAQRTPSAMKLKITTQGKNSADGRDVSANINKELTLFGNH